MISSVEKIDDWWVFLEKPKEKRKSLTISILHHICIEKPIRTNIETTK